MQSGSRAFVWTLATTSVLSAAAGLAVESRPLLLGSSIVGAYALHLYSVRLAIQRSVSDRMKLEEESRSLAREKQELADLRRSLEQKLVRADEQFALLRELVSQRVVGHSAYPATEHSDSMRASPPQSITGEIGKGIAKEDLNRGYGRW
ncbi:MAG: hypothetical protein M8840_10455 [marine benthic group bacterium]|jgi:hypothetical protein|nr:hypothetical protein [Gemmatimonadota bacterium]MCL7991552.1 hypothetical protein [Gemmatimonadota bacterium]